MDFDWGEILELIEEMTANFSGMQGIISPFISLGGIASYILLGIAVMLMGQKLGLNNPWLSWIPYAKSYAFGRIADQYKAEEPLKEEKKGKSAKLLLILNIVQSVLVIPLLILAVLVIVLGIEGLAPVGVVVTLTVVMVLVLLALVAVAIAYSVFYYIAFYRITRLYMGNQYQLWFVLGLVLSLVGISIAIPVVMIILSGKEPFAMKKEGQDFWQQPVAEQPVGEQIKSKEENE